MDSPPAGSWINSWFQVLSSLAWVFDTRYYEPALPIMTICDIQRPCGSLMHSERRRTVTAVYLNVQRAPLTAVSVTASKPHPTPGCGSLSNGGKEKSSQLSTQQTGLRLS